MASAPALNREDSRGFYADDQLASALAYFRGGRYDKAEAIYRKVLKKDSANIGALHMVGLIALKKGRPERAAQLLMKAAKVAPDRPEILCDLGNAFKAMGRHKESVSAHKMVIGILPQSPEAHSNLGSAYNAAGRAEKAVASFESALKLRPRDPELMFNLGNGLIAAERQLEAEEILRQVVYERPDHIRAQINLGVALKESGRFDAALKRFQKAVAAHPDSADAHWNLGLTHLAMGHYADGWAEYEWRTQLDGFSIQQTSRPQWQGEALDGRTLLVHAEQGFGDTIQFARYLTRLKNLDGTVVFACQERLVPLIEALDDMPEIVVLGSTVAHDVQSPLLSLPRLFDDGLPLAPVDPVYIRPDPVRAAKAAALADGKSDGKSGLRIGIAWQGSSSYRHDGRRSIPLACFQPLSLLPGVTLVSLQQGDGTEQIEALSWADKIATLPESTDSDGAFVDTLAVLPELDLVVTSDTAIAHLAGAAGIPVHVALCKLPDWRWGLTGSQSPWYPGMKLFRQKDAGDWTDVFLRIARDIHDRSKG